MSQKARVWANLIGSFITIVGAWVINELVNDGTSPGEQKVIFYIGLAQVSWSAYRIWMTDTFKDAAITQAKIDIDDEKAVKEINVVRSDAGLPAAEVKP